MNSKSILLKIEDKCIKYRQQIALNLYYIHKAYDKLSGNKLAHIISVLQNNNKLLYKQIQMLRCKGINQIFLSMEPISNKKRKIKGSSKNKKRKTSQ